MIHRVIDSNEIAQVETFIRKDYYNCPYFYADLIKYGIDQDRIQLYIKIDENELKFATLMYYDCMHVYFVEDMQTDDDLSNLILKLNPRTIFFPSYPKASIPQLDGYQGKEVLVMGPKSFLDIDTSLVRNASIEDIPRIAQFMYTQWPDIYDSPVTICTQLQERMSDNYGRTKYLESDGEIIACVSSFAELNDFAICGGLLVSSSQRGKNLGSVMLKSIYEELENEGKKTCGIIVEDYSRVFHEKNGFTIVGRIIKYVKDN